MYRFSVAESANPNDYVGTGAAAGKGALLSQRVVARNSPNYPGLTIRAVNEEAKNDLNAASVELIKRREERSAARDGLTDKAYAARAQSLQRAEDNKRFAGKLALAAELYDKGFGEKRKRTEPFQPDFDSREQTINSIYGSGLDRINTQINKKQNELKSLGGTDMTNPSSPKTGSETPLFPVQGDSAFQKVNYVPFEGNNRNRYALTQMIRHAEGTLKHGDLGYRTMFGGGTFDDLSRHPDTVVKTPNYNSAAAGAYQFMPATWKMVQGIDSSITDFTPYNQEKAFDILVRRRGIDPYADIKTDQDLIDVLHTLSPEWASLPTYSGVSRYNQPVKTHQELIDVFRKAKDSYLPPGVI